MAPLNFHCTARTSSARNFSGALLAPSLFIIILMLIFCIIGETANATTIQNNPVIKCVNTETTGPDGATGNTDVYGATDINGVAGPAGPIASDNSGIISPANNQTLTVTPGPLRQ